jgi:hypothetical protein
MGIKNAEFDSESNEKVPNNHAKKVINKKMTDKRSF